ncbi:Thymus-specific serine protease, partial [Perkinsus olseni]
RILSGQSTVGSLRARALSMDFGLTQGSAETNQRYGGKSVNNTDNILSINGDVDPWLGLSVTQSQPGSPAIVIPGAGHALWALMSKIDDSDFKKYYDEILEVVSGWLDLRKPARLRRGSSL